MTALEVFLTRDATRDLEELHEYIFSNDSPGKARQVLEQIGRAFSSLSESPNRGAHPKELLDLGIREYREIFFKPHRILYKVSGNRVFVVLIADGRRDTQALLQRRLLAP